MCPVECTSRDTVLVLDSHGDIRGGDLVQQRTVWSEV